MARQTITPVAVTGKWPTALAALTFTAADTSNKEQMILTGREILIIFNSDASPHTVTIDSVTDPTTNRTGSLTTVSVAAGAYKMIGPLAPDGWRNSSGYLTFEASDATVKYAAIQLPS